MTLPLTGVKLSKQMFMDQPVHRSNYYYCEKQTVNLKSLATSNYGSDVDIINEDGELATAYEAQKGINRQLQEELIAEKKFYSEHISKSKSEIEKLREENEKYQNGEDYTNIQVEFRRHCNIDSTKYITCTCTQIIVHLTLTVLKIICF